MGIFDEKIGIQGLGMVWEEDSESGGRFILRKM
jgi:hypothetical protein